MEKTPAGGREGEQAYSTIWERAARDSSKSRVALSYDRIAAAAVEIADADGLDAVSMRKLAQHLGVATMATYRYVSGKDDLYELMTDACHAEIRLDPAATSHWKSALVSYAEQMRAMTARHPWIVGVPDPLPGVLTPHMAAVVEQVLDSMGDLETDVDSKMAMLTSITAFVHGATAAEVAQRQLMLRRGWSTDDEVRGAYHPYMSGLTSSSDYPRLADYLVNGTNRDDGAWQFEFGLDCLLTGIAIRLGS